MTSTPSQPTTPAPAGMPAKIVDRRASLVRTAASAARRPLMSKKLITAPAMRLSLAR